MLAVFRKIRISEKRISKILRIPYTDTGHPYHFLPKKKYRISAYQSYTDTLIFWELDTDTRHTVFFGTLYVGIDETVPNVAC